jgi:MFS family permease
MTEIAAETDGHQTVARDIKLVGLISAAHGMSHFYGLVLPPIFPLLTDAFGVGYTEFGLLAALTYVASGVMQTPAGMLVDRVGPAPVLIAGLGLLSGAILFLGLAPGFWWLVPLSIVAGLGSCVFHPADYAIMNARVGASRLGRAYSAHSLAGNIGWVAAPASVLGLTGMFGWRAALVMLGGAGLGFTLYLASQRAVLSEAEAQPRTAVSSVTASGGEAATGILLSLPVLMCFVYFALLSIALAGLETFLPSAVVAAFGVSIAAGNMILTAFLLAASLGVLVGGFLTDRFPRHQIVVAIGLAGAALFSLVLAVATPPVAGLLACASLAGLALGGAGPARDMLVRGATPAGATGKVFGFVYSGLDLGAVIASPVLGLLLDQGLPRLVFLVAAIALFGAIGTAFAVGIGNVAAASGGDAESRPA